jgi:hypothetical protein
MKRISHSYTQLNTAPSDKVFPLLCPVREAEWVPGWKFRLLHSSSGFAELGCVFTTPNDDSSETTWIVTHYDPPRNVAFTWVWPGMIATRLTIQLSPTDNRHTGSQISYEYTALTEAGERRLQSYDDVWFASKMTEWEQAINHFLQTGNLITTSSS